MNLRQGIGKRHLILKSDRELYEFACRAIASMEELIRDNEDILRHDSSAVLRREAAMDLVEDYRIAIHWTRVKILYKHCKYE